MIRAINMILFLSKTNKICSLQELWFITKMRTLNLIEKTNKHPVIPSPFGKGARARAKIPVYYNILSFTHFLARIEQ